MKIKQQNHKVIDWLKQPPSIQLIKAVYEFQYISAEELKILKEWLNANIKDYCYVIETSSLLSNYECTMYIFFENENDAIAFKLRFTE